MAISSIPSPIHNPKLCTDAPPRTLDQFESRREVLFALRDAIAGESLPVHVCCSRSSCISIQRIKLSGTRLKSPMGIYLPIPFVSGMPSRLVPVASS